MKNWKYRAVEAVPSLKGDVRIPGDKSVSHRAVMLGSIANGVTEVRGFLPGEDTLATAEIFRRLGVAVDRTGDDSLRIHGVGLHGLKEPTSDLESGNAGTAMRLLVGMLAGQRFRSVLTGDSSLRSRPMSRVLTPLRTMGADIGSQPGELAPLSIRPVESLLGIEYKPDVASAQVKSCVLLAGLYAEGSTRVTESHPTRDYTERLVRHMDYPIEFERGFAQLAGGHGLRGTVIDVPADFSSAAFLIVAATLMPGSCITLRNVGLSPTRTGLLHALSLMGANISVTDMRDGAADRTGDITVRHAELEGAEIPHEIVPDMIDEFPVLFVAAAMARGETVIRGAAELRVKESDRIESMLRGLRAMGAQVEGLADGAIVRGGHPLRGASVDAFGDHRIAMSFAVLAAAANVDMEIKDVANVATSFPAFESMFGGLGMTLEPFTA